MRRPLVALSLGAALVGCGDKDETTGPTNTLASVTVSAASSSIAVGATTQLTATGTNAAGATLTGVTFTYSSGASTIASVNATTGLVTGVAPGTATITATGTLGGVTKTGTTVITVTAAQPPLTASVTAGSSATVFTPATVEVRPGGTVTWTFGALAHNVTFRSATGAPANIPTSANTSVARTFATAGSFPYDCTIHAGMSGTVTVR
jgi:plastocyanin